MKHSFKVGDKVQSHFRAPWKGVIVEGPDETECYIVKVFLDQHNNVMRKFILKQLNGAWLEKKDWVFPLDKLPNFD